MKTTIAAAALGLILVAPAMADTCKATADAKKLHGAAQTSFTTKCVKDAVGQ
jgi:hypothetical protein